MTKSISFILFLVCFNSLNLLADAPYSDVVELIFEDQMYYFQFESRGMLNGDNQCYYSYESEPPNFEYLCEISDIIDQYLKDEYTVFYETLEIVDISKCKGSSGDSLFLLKDTANVNLLAMIGNYEINMVYKGSNYGLIHSSGINETDNHWLADYDIERYFSLDNIEMCEVNFYGIANNLTTDEKIFLKEKLQSLGKSIGDPEFQKEIDLLYQVKIIMLGFCGC